MNYIILIITIFLACLAQCACSDDKPTFDREQFWSMDDMRRIPLDAEIVSSRDEDGFRLEEIYFTTELHPDGPTRVFIMLARPISPTKPVPVFLFIHGGGGHAIWNPVMTFARQLNCAVAALDWSGQAIKGAPRSTIWRGDDPNPFATRYIVKPQMKDCSVYRITMAARRTLDYLEAQSGIDPTRIAVGGASWGGFYSNLLAGVDSRVKCTFCYLGAGALSESAYTAISSSVNALPPDQRRQWVTRFDPASYAPHATARTLQYACTNDVHFWLGDVLDNYGLLSGDKRLLLRPNSNHDCGGQPVPYPGPKWLQACFGQDVEYPRIVEGSFRGHVATYTWKCEGPAEITSSQLYWSPGEVAWTARYWMAIPAEKSGDTWQASVPKELSGLSGAVFATACDAKDRAVSTGILHRRGANPSDEPGPLWAGDAIWDAKSGAAAWRETGQGATLIETAPNGAVELRPAKGVAKITAITNSVVLASGWAKANKGIRLLVNGCGQAGKLKIALQRDCGSTKELAYSVEARYGRNLTTLDLPWVVFKGPKGSPKDPYPFDGLRIEADRADGTPIVIESMGFMPSGGAR